MIRYENRNKGNRIVIKAIASEKRITESSGNVKSQIEKSTDFPDISHLILQGDLGAIRAETPADCRAFPQTRPRFSIQPDSLLLQPLFQITHFAIENLVVVVFFQLLNIAGQFRLLLNNIA